MTEASSNRDDLLAHLAQGTFEEYRQAPTLTNFLTTIEAIGTREAGDLLMGWWTECPPSSDTPVTDLLGWLARLKPWPTTADPAHAVAVRGFYYEEKGLKRLLDRLP